MSLGLAAAAAASATWIWRWVRSWSQRLNDSKTCKAEQPDSETRPLVPCTAPSTLPGALQASTEAQATSLFSLEALKAELEEIRANPPVYVSRIGELVVPTLVCDSDGELTQPKGDGPWDHTVSISGGLPAEDVAAYQAAADSLTDLRRKSWQATKALAATEDELSRARKRLEEVEREASGGSAGSRAHFVLLPSVGTWLTQRDCKEASSPDVLEAGQVRVQQARAEESAALGAESEAESMTARLRTSEAYNFPFRVRIRFTTAWPTAPPSSVRFQCVFHHALTDDDGGMPEPFYKTLPKEGDSRHTLRGLLKAIHEFLVNPLSSWGVPLDCAPQRFHQSMVNHQHMNEQRLGTIRKYREQVRHRELFETPPQWREEWFDSRFWHAQQEGTPHAWRALLTEHLPGEVYSFPIFREEFCKTFVEEIFNFYASGLPARRPNSMNNYGIILNEIGLEPMIDELQRMLQPLGELLWPGPGHMWDGHHCFIVRYREGEDLGLDMHTDDSDVTFNVCFGMDFQAAGLQFCGLMGAGNHRKHSFTYKHVKGTCVCHLGRKRHGADDISSGERLNLILWNHSSTYRQSTEYMSPPYVKEEGAPDQVCVSYTHDRDYGSFKEYPKGKENFRGRGWCPPKSYEYVEFKPDSDEADADTK